MHNNNAHAHMYKVLSVILPLAQGKHVYKEIYNTMAADNEVAPLMWSMANAAQAILKDTLYGIF